MYAIVEIAGQQYKVEKSQKIFVHRLEDKEGSKVNFDKVLLIDNDKNIVVGEPTVKNALVKATVLSHMKGDKVVVFKKKRRKGYKVKNGHRQYLTQIQIEDILEKGTAKKPAAKKTETTTKKETEKKTITKAKAETKDKTESKTKTVKKETKKEDK